MRLFLYPFLLGDMSDLNFQVAKSVAEQAETLWQTMIFSGPLFGQVLNVGLGICCLTIGFFAIELTFNSLEGNQPNPLPNLFGLHYLLWRLQVVASVSRIWATLSETARTM